MVPPAKKLEDLIHLAELCVDLLQQNEEHYAEVITHHSFRTLSGSHLMWNVEVFDKIPKSIIHKRV